MITLTRLTNRWPMMAFALLASLWLSSCDDDDSDATTPEATQSVVGFAQENDQLSVLAEAVGQAGLADVLKQASRFWLEQGLAE